MDLPSFRAILSNRRWSLCTALGPGLALVLTTSAFAGDVDSFVIGLEQEVSDGVPGRGAGNIEAPGAIDEYTFTLERPTDVYFDELSGNCGIRWSCVGPNGTEFSNNIVCVTDVGTRSLAAGVYTITVTGTVSGAYSFILWEVEAPQLFVIELESPVSNGVPGPGAGALESPGEIDLFEFTIDAPTTVYFDELAGNCWVFWSCVGPDDAVIFTSHAFCIEDPGSIELELPGVYTIEVSGSIGLYSFNLWEVEAPDFFEIELESAVSSGVPGPGAGLIEEPGARDIYEFTISKPTTVYFDELAGSCSAYWSCVDPRGGPVFTNNALCVSDPGAIPLTTPGTYTIEVFGAAGPYGFNLWDVAAPQEFDIVLNQVIAPRQPGPGAGQLEEPGAVDIYRLQIDSPTTIFFDELSGVCNIFWRCVAPDGEVLFTNDAICVGDPGSRSLLAVGEYLITVHSASTGVMGPYSFSVLETEPPEVFDIAVGDTVSPGVPGPGAGVLEEPGSIDLFRFEAEAGEAICLDELAGSCAIAWFGLTPSGAVFFTDGSICVGTPPMIVFTETGTHTLVVHGQGDGDGEFSFAVESANPFDLSGDCLVGAADIALLLGAWGPCTGSCAADFNDDGAVNAADLATLLGAW